MKMSTSPLHEYQRPSLYIHRDRVRHVHVFDDYNEYCIFPNNSKSGFISYSDDDTNCTSSTSCDYDSSEGNSRFGYEGDNDMLSLSGEEILLEDEENVSCYFPNPLRRLICFISREVAGDKSQTIL